MQGSHTSFIWPLTSGQAGPMSLIRVPDGAVIADLVEPALDSATRRRGLLGRDGLAAGAAMIIAPCNAVHTFFMRFAIDVVFVTRGGTVVKISPEVPAWRMTAAPRAWATIEFPAGAAAARRLAVGDVVALTSAADQGSGPGVNG
jgi:uncharacterized protein